MNSETKDFERRSIVGASRPRKILTLGALIGIPIVCFALAGIWYESPFPKNFAPVDENKLFRSGTVTLNQLKNVADKYKIKSVLCLLNPDVPAVAQEQAAAEKLGLHWFNVKLPGNGSSTPEQREQIKKVLDAPDIQPLLVHCAAGANRTGLAIGLYRIHHQGWTAEQVLQEMNQFGFENDAKHENLREALVAEAGLARARSESSSGSGLP